MKSVLSLFFFVAMSFGFGAHADELASDFREAGRQIPTALLARGYQNFGALNLSALINKIDSVQVGESSGDVVGKRNADGRISARWENDGRRAQITVNRKAWMRWPEDRPLLALHEYLGVSGFNDRNYWLSTKLWFLSLEETHSVVSNEDSSAVEQNLIQRVSVSGGGVIGVGGGGEISTMHFRAQNLKDNLQRMRRARESQNSREYEIYRQQLPSLLESHLSVTYDRYIPPSKSSKPAAVQQPPRCMTSEQECLKFKEISGSCTCPGSPNVYGTVIWPY